MTGEVISCVMVTLPVAARLESFKSAVRDYLRQSYVHRELLILVNRGDVGTRASMAEYVTSLQRSDVRFVAASDELNLGQLRDLALDLASGTIVCQWDDDDLHHPLRLERQLTALGDDGGEAVLLQDVMHFFRGTEALYWTNWAATEAGGHPGTLMMRKSARVRYPALGLAEDLDVARALKARGTLRFITGEPYLFIYVTHGTNSWAMSHHRMLADTLAISRSLLLRREAVLRGGLQPFTLPEGLWVQGNNGSAFRL